MVAKQAGMSLLSTMIILIMIGFFLMCGVRMAPHYLEYTTIRSVVKSVAAMPGMENESLGTIRRKIEGSFNTNRVTGLAAKEVEIYRDEGKVYIDASYEARVPVVANIDAVMKFDDLKVMVGSPIN